MEIYAAVIQSLAVKQCILFAVKYNYDGYNPYRLQAKEEERDSISMHHIPSCPNT